MMKILHGLTVMPTGPARDGKIIGIRALRTRFWQTPSSSCVNFGRRFTEGRTENECRHRGSRYSGCCRALSVEMPASQIENQAMADAMKSGSAGSWIRGLRGWGGLCALTLIAYGPALGAGFVWDDDAHVPKAAMRSLHGLWRIWFELGSTQQYYPALFSSFWLEHRLWGDAAFGYHLTNILLHATSAWLFAMILRRLAIPGA